MRLGGGLMKGVNKGLIMGSMKKLFKLILLIILISPSSAYALSCAPPTKIIVGECENRTCTKGFRIDIDYGRKEGCQPFYSFTEAKKHDLKQLNIRIDWEAINEGQSGVFQLSPNAMFVKPENSTRLNEHKLSHARNHWKYKVLLINLYFVSWHVLDIFIALFCAGVLMKSIVNFKKKYIYKEQNVSGPFFQQLAIFLFSLISVFYMAAFYTYYWTAIFFILIPLIWVVMLISVALNELNAQLKKR